MIKKLLAGVLLATLAGTAVAPVASAHHTMGKNIVERAIQVNNYSGAFDTLLAAAQCDYFGTSVVDALSQPSTTLFAPTDRAFRKLGLNKKNICSTYQADQAALLDILTYHVYDGAVTYRDARRAVGTSLTMLNGEPAAITGRWWRVKIDGARIVLPNVRASNGFIHVVNNVLLP
jgi:uncharacterized surface protein with fasciclin (FAS1) repeats